jgi:hypothetical protein
MLIDLLYFDADPFGMKEIVSIGSGFGVMVGMAILSYTQELLYHF